MKSLRTVLGITLFALLVCVGLMPCAPAHAGPNSRVVTKPFKFIEAGALASTVKDSMFVTDEVDTARTTLIDISDLDWDAVLQGGSVATGFPIAKIWFVATRASNGAADTMYFAPEKALNIPLYLEGSATKNAADTLVYAYNGTLAGGVGGSAIAAFGSVRGGLLFEGVLTAIPNTNALGNMWLARGLRLKTFGDQSGTTPVLSGVRGWISYLAKPQ